jgi:phosphate transport system protein
MFALSWPDEKEGVPIVWPEIHPHFMLLSQNVITLAPPRNSMEGGAMASPVSKLQTIYQDVLANYLISMARTVESSVGCALDALLRPNLEVAAELSSKVFLVEPRVNEMEILIDDHAVRMLRTGLLDDEEIRRVVSSQKIANDLERIGDLAVNISERVISLAGMNVTETPRDLEPMAGAVRGMLGRSLGALIFRNVVLAGEVLEADDVVDRYRDQIFEHLLNRMTEDGRQAAPQLQFVLATRYLERIADHSTNIAEDIIFWVRGLDVRHGRVRMAIEEANYPEKRS